MTLKIPKIRFLLPCAVLLLAIAAGALPLFVPALPPGEPFPETEAFHVAFEQGGVSVGAESAILIDGDSGSVLYAKNPDERRGMASTTKIMTAYAVLSSLPTEAVVEITPEMTGVEGSSLYLKAGEKLTVEELLYGLLLESGNDSAVALAIACDGSVEAFAERMNETAKELGLENTRFANPHGLSEEGHYTTARELAMLTAEALKNETFARIVATYQTRIPYEGIEGGRYLTNHNPLLKSFEGMIGVKTGWTTADGKCFVSAARREGMTLIGVTLGDTGISATHRRLLEFGFEHFEKRTLQVDVPLQLPLVGGEASFLAAEAEALTLTLPKTGEVTVRIDAAPFVYAGTAKGTPAGRAVFLWNGVEVGSTPLVTAEEAPAKKISLWEKWFG
ncbi:MAG: D-alanyl-D-alanine carboxypeptidase [Ruminococcaceae bacterium]|nr:D-alanyl-D-alanine carboxypeptidase [Oscillospiraceae bacterium]